MKRDLDLIRSILLEMETSEGFDFVDVKPEGYEGDDEKFNNHLILMDEAGLITGEFNFTSDHRLYSYEIRMTNNGYEYISMAKNVRIWERLKKTIKEKGIDIPIEIAKQMLISYTKEILKV